MEDNFSRVSSAECSDSFPTKQRKRRKWDQPDESLISSHALANIGSLSGVAIPTTVSSTSLATFSTSGVISPQAAQVPLQQPAATIVQNLVQSRIQDELVSKEIIINDTDSAIRYKLTKRQMQEEIQKCTGAVVITRGKYRLPNHPPDGERPLYLHISAASHFETTAERIKAVDQAAAMIEEMLKQGSVCNGTKADRLLSTRVFLGFEADPSLNIASRIHGPNDQYVNHIMNETGATVLLRGCGSGHSINESTEETQQPLHLLLSSDDSRSLEHAKLLAENLLDTISAECGTSRVLPCNKYTAVPPPSQFQARLLTLPSASTTVHSSVSITETKPPMSLSIGVKNPGITQANTSYYPHSSLNDGTSYTGYGGIYPQVTPLQQVALALRQSTSPVTTTANPIATAVNKVASLEAPPSLKDKHPQKRKFQESPALEKGPACTNKKNLQGSEFPMPRELTSHVGARDASAMPPPHKNCVPKSFGEMPPPPPPPPKFDSTAKMSSNNLRLPKFSSNAEPNGSNAMLLKSKPGAVPDTLINLMEYGDDEDDDDDEETDGKALKIRSNGVNQGKPFWAV